MPPPMNMPPIIPPPPMPDRREPRASNSSMKTAQPPHFLARFLAIRLSIRTLRMSMPRNMPAKEAPEVVMIGSWRLEAIALASMVLPVPGGPTIRIPRSRSPPAWTYLLPCSISRRIFFISSTAACWPRTSESLTCHEASPGSVAPSPIRA